MKNAILTALRGEPSILPEPPAELLIAEFADSGVSSRVRVWTTDVAADEPVQVRA